VWFIYKTLCGLYSLPKKKDVAYTCVRFIHAQVQYTSFILLEEGSELKVNVMYAHVQR
jgi:hypothetical protein